MHRLPFMHQQFGLMKKKKVRFPVSKCPKAKTPFKLTQEAQSLVPVQIAHTFIFTALCYYLKFHMKCFMVKNKQKSTDFQWLK